MSPEERQELTEKRMRKHALELEKLRTPDDKRRREVFEDIASAKATGWSLVNMEGPDWPSPLIIECAVHGTTLGCFLLAYLEKGKTLPPPVCPACAYFRLEEELRENYADQDKRSARLRIAAATALVATLAYWLLFEGARWSWWIE